MVAFLCGKCVTMQDTAIEMNSLISLEKRRSQVAKVKWHYLTIKDKVDVFTVNKSRDIINNKNALAYRSFVAAV